MWNWFVHYFQRGIFMHVSIESCRLPNCVLSTQFTYRDWIQQNNNWISFTRLEPFAQNFDMQNHWTQLFGRRLSKWSFNRWFLSYGESLTDILLRLLVKHAMFCRSLVSQFRIKILPIGHDIYNLLVVCLLLSTCRLFYTVSTLVKIS